MIELLFVACLSADPTACERRSLIYADITPRTCALRAQPELAKWVAAHPEFAVRQWRCRAVRPGERDI